ncbi:MAG: enoyl-CoA hydratase/isomerase family protein [Gammaproteobacteria bacterium]|nr:enoyl-CoA hydratase/isomerase family protein [Gammaproteobacteria bacterium]
MQNIRLLVDDGLAVATLDMPNRPFNVFSEDMIDELEMLVATIERERWHGLVVISGKPTFMAGADLVMVQGFTTLRFEAEPDEIRARFSRLQRLLRRLERVGTTTVAAIDGFALGGGLELAMACHYRVAVASTQPTLGLPEVGLGLLPGAGGTQRLPRLVGAGRGAAMLLHGRPIPPAQALAWGLVDELTSKQELLAAARARAAQSSPGARWDRAAWQMPADASWLDGTPAQLLATAGVAVDTAPLYPALGAICRCVIDGYPADIDAGFDVEVESFLGLMLDPVAGNMVRTKFLAKGDAPKRAARRFGKQAAPRTLCWRGEGAPPVRLAKAFELVTGEAETTIAPVSFVWGSELRLEHGSAAATIRTLGPLDSAEACEVAGTAGDAAALAVAIANRCGLVPVAAARSALTVLVEAAAAACEACGAERLAGIAAALDLGRVFEVAGVRGAPRAEPDLRAGHAVLTAIALAAVQLLDAGVVASAPELDVLAVFALGYPAWTGGPLSWLDMLARGEVPGATQPAECAGRVFHPRT